MIRLLKKYTIMLMLSICALCGCNYLAISEQDVQTVQSHLQRAQEKIDKLIEQHPEVGLELKSIGSDISEAQAILDRVSKSKLPDWIKVEIREILKGV